MSQRPLQSNTREGLFRFGQEYINANIEFRIARSPLLKMIVKGLPDDALGKGHDLVELDEKGEPTEDFVDWNDEYQKESTKQWSEFMHAVYDQRGYEKSLMLFTTMPVSKVFKLWAFRDDEYEVKYNDAAEIEKGSADLNILEFTQTIKIPFPETSKDVGVLQDGVPLENVRELIKKRKRVKQSGVSDIEAIWDIDVALYMLISHSAYFVARAGSGIKELKYPESMLDDAGSTTNLITSAAQFGAGQDVIVIPKSIDGIIGNDVEFDIKTIDNAADWLALLDLYLTMAAIETGIPLTMLKGVTPGQLEGALVNQESRFDVLRDIQDAYESDIKWYSERIAKRLGKDPEKDKYAILQRVREVQTEEQETVQIVQKLTTFQSLTGRKVKPDKVATLLKLKLTEADLEEKQEIPIMGGDSDERKEDAETGGEESETQEDEEEEEELK